MGNALNLFPGEERGVRGNQADFYNTPPPSSTHSQQGDYGGVRTYLQQVIQNHSTASRLWQPPEINPEIIHTLQGRAYYWRTENICVIRDLSVFGHLPREEDIKMISVIMPFMGHVYKVLSVIIKQHMDLLHNRYGMSQRYRVEDFHFEVTDDLLHRYELAWRHYQNALQIVYTNQRHANPEDEGTRLTQNPLVNPHDPRHARTAFIQRASPDNPDQVLLASEEFQQTQQYTPSGQQSRQRNHSPVLHHVKYRPQGVDSGHGHFHENISDLSRKGMGSLENFEKNTYGVSEHDGHVTTISPFPTKGYTNVATSPFNTFKHTDQKQDDLLLENQPTVHIGQQHFIQQVDPSQENKPTTLLNFSTDHVLSRSQNHLHQQPTVLNTRRKVNTFSSAEIQPQNQHAEELDSAEMENYVSPHIGNSTNTTNASLQRLYQKHEGIPNRFSGLIETSET